MIGISIIKISDAFRTRYTYLTFNEVTSNDTSIPATISGTFDMSTYSRYVFIKCVNITLTGTLPSVSVSQGFTTDMTLTTNINSSQLYVKYNKDDPNANYYKMSVTWIVMIVNSALYKQQTSQFTNMKIIVQWDYTQSGSIINLLEYNSSYKSNLLIGQS